MTSFGKLLAATLIGKTLSAKAEYQNNVSHVDAIFLHTAAYSDF